VVNATIVIYSVNLHTAHREIREGGFKVCFNQGDQCRLFNDETAATLASVRYYDDDFRFRRIYSKQRLSRVVLGNVHSEAGMNQRRLSADERKDRI
jgi:hypothetical protein